MTSRSALALVSVAASLLVACGGSVALPVPSSDASVDVTASDVPVTDRGTVDAPPTDAPTADAPITDAPPADVPADAPLPMDVIVPSDIASRQRVRFLFNQALGGDGGTAWVVTAGWQCGGLAIDGIALGLPFQCLCECPNPGGPALTEAHAVPLASATPYAVEWDARSLVVYTVPYDCSTHGWPGAGIQQERHAVGQPVAAGHYVAHFVVLGALPSGCVANPDGTATCPMHFGGPGFPFGGSYGLCPGGTTLDVPFDLPAAGDVTVPVTVR